MTETEFKQQIKRLSNFTGYPKEDYQFKELFQTFKKCDILPFTKAITEIYNGDEYFPKPKTIWAKYYKFRDEVSPKKVYFSLTCACGQSWSLEYPPEEITTLKCCNRSYSKATIMERMETTSTGHRFVEFDITNL